MAQQDILPTDAGDTSLTKIEANFTELYGDVAGIKTKSDLITPASASAPASLDLHEDTDNGTNKITITAPSAVASDKVLTLPDATDTLVGKDTTDTLTNKTLTSPLFTGIVDGWISVAGTWSASDANTISVASLDLTSVLQKGDKIKLTNNSATKYFYITTTPAFSTNTTFYVTGEVDLVAGAITNPYYSKILNPQGIIDGTIKYKCSVTRTNQLNIAQNVDTRITYDTETFDVGNNFDAVTNKVFIAPITGYYQASVIIYWQNVSVGENISGNIKVNGSAVLTKAINTAAITFGYDFFFGGLVYMTKGQYLEVTTLHDGAGSTQDIAFSRLMINFVSI